MKNWISYTSVLGGLLLVLGTFLPLWEKNGVAVNGWEGDYLSTGRWVLVLAAVLAVLAAVIPVLRKPRWLAVAGLAGLLESGLVFWRGYKLQAVGWGIWALLAGAVLLLLAAVWLRISAGRQGDGKES